MKNQIPNDPHSASNPITEIRDLIELEYGPKGSPDRDKFDTEVKATAVGSLLRSIRRKRGLTQDDVGKILGVSKSQIARLESKDSNVTMETLERFSYALQTEFTINARLLPSNSSNDDCGFFNKSNETDNRFNRLNTCDRNVRAFSNFVRSPHPLSDRVEVKTYNS